MKPRITFLFGFAEGPRIAKKLRTACENKGFRYTKNQSEADCVVTHSGGSLLLDKQSTPKVVIIVAPSAGHTKFLSPLAKAQIIKIRQQSSPWKKSFLWNIYYAFFKPIQTARLAHRFNQSANKSLPLVNSKNTIVLVGDNDIWAQYINIEQVAKYPDYAFATYRGHHDQLWESPKAFSELLHSLYKTAILKG